MDVEGYRRTSREVWHAMAPGWERWRARLADALTPVREWLIAELGPQRGEMVLELGAGTGETGFEAAAILGGDGRLISTDFSLEMVDVARRRGSEVGLSNVDWLRASGRRSLRGRELNAASTSAPVSAPGSRALPRLRGSKPPPRSRHAREGRAAAALCAR